MHDKTNSLFTKECTTKQIVFYQRMHDKTNSLFTEECTTKQILCLLKNARQNK